MGTEEKAKHKKRIKRKSAWREEAREGIWKAEWGGRSEGEMWACLIQRTVVVTCPSAQSIGRTRKKEEDGIWRKRGQKYSHPLHHHPHSIPGTWGLSHGWKLTPQASYGKKDLPKKRHSNMIFPTFSQNLFTLCSNPPKPLISAGFFFFFFKSNTCTPHTNISACIQFVHTHTSTSMSSCTLQPFPPCVRFTRHFCCLPWVFRVMLCVESSQPNSPAWSQMAWCGWLWLCLLSSPDRHMMNHIPAPSKTAHRGRYTGSLTNTARSSARREKQLSSTRFLHGD